MKERKSFDHVLAEARRIYNGSEPVEARKVLEHIFGKDALVQTKEPVYIDLGLPSGTLWAEDNAPGYYTFDEAVKEFGPSLPTATQMVELYEQCSWRWADDDKGYVVTGPNGKSIFLPAAGYRDADGDECRIGDFGEYWTSCEDKSSAANGRSLYFVGSRVYPLHDNARASGFAVRAVRE